MKLDKKYFEQIVERFNEFEDFYFYSEAHATIIEKPEIISILHQIARDAAEAQRGKCFNDKFPCQKEGCTDCINALAIPDGE